MSIIEQVKELRALASIPDIDAGGLYDLNKKLYQAADIIEALSAKLQAANMDKEQQYDKIMHINTYLLERYGDKLWEEFGIKKTGDTQKDMLSAMKIFDEIYKREKEKYPLMWYEYCLCANTACGDKSE